MMAEFENFAIVDCLNVAEVFDSMLQYFDGDVALELLELDVDYDHSNFDFQHHELVEAGVAAESADGLIFVDNDDDSF